MPAPAKRPRPFLRALDPAREARETRVGWRMASVGMQASSEVIAGALLGWLVDHYAGTGHWGVLVGGCVGIVVALTTLIRVAWKMNAEMDTADARDRAANAPLPGKGSAAPPDEPRRRERPR